MTYYEELGVSQEATQDEIRRAFRNACRLLHPDLQQDPILRQLAEMQMRRLNEVVETLCEDSRRAAYDKSTFDRATFDRATSVRATSVRATSDGFQHPDAARVRFSAGALESIEPRTLLPVGAQVRPLAAVFAGLLLGCLLMYCLVVLTTAPVELRGGTPEPVENSASQRPLLTKPASKAQLSVSARSIPPASISPTAPPDPSPPDSSATNPSATDLSSPPLALSPGAPIFSQPVPPPAAESSSTQKKTLSDEARATAPAASLGGIWLYVPDLGDRPDKGEYQAEFIEMKIQESGGEIQGSFRSRYRISDRPLNPAVNFRFRGPANSTQFQWEGPGGSAGTLKLTLKSPMSLDADWEAQAVGSQLGLASGTATLIRRME